MSAGTATLNAYADTSVLVSLYTPDANSLEAEKLFGVPDEIVISSLSVLEFTNAVELRVMRQEISLASAEASIKAFRADIESGIYRYRAVPPASYETGSMLARRYTRQFRVRSLDILHVAIALELGAAAFLTFDQAQRRLAHAAGMKVRPK